MRWLTLLIALGATAPARGAELQVELAPAFKKSTWAGDSGGGAQLRIGFRFIRWLALDVGVGEELHAVDLRLITALSIGLTGNFSLGRTRPLLRLYFVHQHEEGLVSVKQSPFTTLIGIGDGIRHRAGAGLDLGVEVLLLSRPKWQLFIAPALTATIIPDTELGPAAYVGLHIGLGFNLPIVLGPQ